MTEKPINERANQLHQEARFYGQQGKYDLSIQKLSEAIQIEPEWAYPYYDLAFTYLLKNEFDLSLKFYKKTDQLMPKGFFTTKTAIYTLEGEEKEIFPKGLYLYYMQIEWSETEREKLEIAKNITKKVPTFAPAWKELSNFLEDPIERLEVINEGLKLMPDDETKGILMINKSLIFDSLNRTDESVAILENLIVSSDTTISNLALAKFALQSLKTN